MKTTESAPRVAVATLGCKVNQCESADLAAALERRGFTVTSFAQEADVYIVNTCTVTQRTDYQSRQLIRRVSRRNPQAFIVVTGCYAQINPAEIASLPGVAVVAGNRDKGAIPQIVAGLWLEKKNDESLRKEQCRPFGPSEKNEFWGMSDVTRLPDHTRAFLKIQDGCNAFCSYCIVPYARGRSRSLSPEAVHRQLSQLAATGCKEAVLTGIHLGCYGQDILPPTTLTAVLQQIEEQKPIERLRLSSLEPREITNELLRLLSEAKALCPHLHIPLQSGDDEVLLRMNRNYGAAFFRSLVGRIVAARSDTAIGVDVMVGFPGEDERAFDHTYGLIEDLPVAYLHVFPYSKRPGTPACTMADQVQEGIKKKRAERLRSLGQEKRRAFMKRFLGQRLDVLLEDRMDKNTGLYKGFSRNYIPVTIVNAGPALVNTVVSIMAEQMGEGGLIGRVVHE